MKRMQSVLTVAAVACLAGCATPGWLKFGKDDFPVADAKNPVVQIVPLWQATRGIGLEDKPCRGFGGQLLFITPESTAAARVDGTVHIWVFDDHGTPEQQAKALHRFEFMPEAWDAHRFESKLGMCYSVFIPYTRPGSQEGKCSLIVRYTPREGPAVVSETVQIDLSGTKKKADSDDSAGSYEAAQRRDAPQGVVQAAYAEEQAQASRARKDHIQQIAAEMGASSIGLAHPQARRRLTREDEERILRETRARLAAESSHADVNEQGEYFVSYDEDEPALAARADEGDWTEKAPPLPRRPHALSADALGAARPAPPSEEEWAIETDAADERQSNRPIRRQHALSENDASESEGTQRRRTRTTTIGLSGVR